MVGYPKHLNTREDFEYVRQNFPEKAKQEFQNLLDSSMCWYFTRSLADDEVGVEDATHKVLTTKQQAKEEGGEEIVSREQYELRENPTAKIFLLGYSVAEVEEIIAAMD